MTPAKPARAPAQPPKAASPGRPKDQAKRAAILEAAKRMFVQHGFDRVSMDQVAAEAGVSKLTVYSHFGDKDSLFAEAVRAHCEQNLPQRLFEAAPDAPLRERLLAIGQAFFAMIMAPEAVAGHRILCSPQVAARGMAGMFWEAGPERVKAAFRNLPDLKFDQEMLDLAAHIIDTRAGSFKPQTFVDQYDEALHELVEAKIAGKPLPKRALPKQENVVDLRDALRRSASLADGGKPATKRKKAG